MVLALLLTAVEPRIGGVLLRGEKGTAKTTAARALAALLPGGAPFRTLPLGATEDRLAGGLDLERSVAEGRPVLAPGLLSHVHGGVLYVDEINLLDDHLVDMLLDVTASGTNVVEREGLSLTHPSQFVLVGSMNPEEGDLRPELLDRFGMCVDITSENDPQQRVELMRRRLLYDQCAAGFVELWDTREKALRERVRSAQELLPDVVLGRDVAQTIAHLSCEANVAGHRADLALAAAARAHAAWTGRSTVRLSDVTAVSELVLCHRRRDAIPPQQEPSREQTPSDSPATEPPDDQSGDGEQETGTTSGPTSEPTSSRDSGPRALTGPDGSGEIDVQPAPDRPSDGTATSLPASPVGAPFRVRRLEPVPDSLARTGSGRRLRTRSADRHGRYVSARRSDSTRDLALDATVRAGAPYQRARRLAWAQTHPDREPPAFLVRPSDFHQKVRERRVGSCIVFVVDASGSMGAKGRMAASKGAVLSLLLDAYQKRDKVAMIAFRRERAQVLLEPTSSIHMASQMLTTLPIGGRTPLSSALVETHRLVSAAMRKDPTLRPLVVLVSDGRANVPATSDAASALEEALQISAHVGRDARVRWVVVDTEDARGLRLRLAERLAANLHAEHLTIDNLRADDLVNLVKGHTA